MIIYYTFKNKTKIFAEALGTVLNKPLYELKCDLNKKSNFWFMFHAFLACFTRNNIPVTNMPSDIVNTESSIFVCSPIWGGEIAAPVKYFLQNANLKGVTVNLLLTASIPTGKHKLKAIDFLNKLSCNTGEVYMFATSSKLEIETDVVKEHLQEMMDV